MTDAYISKYENGDTDAIASMIDFYGGLGTFASWPAAVRAYAVRTTPTNILDWGSAYAFGPSVDALAQLILPVLVGVGRESHPAVALANKLISEFIPNSTYCTIEGASHFMIATHPSETAKLIINHLNRVTMQKA